MTRIDSPWYISGRAVSRYASILGLESKNDADFFRCEDELVAIARVATFVKISASGLLEYRGKVPVESRHLVKSLTKEIRLALFISTEKRVEGDLPQLVDLKLRGQR